MELPSRHNAPRGTQILVVPNWPMDFPTKNDQHLGCFLNGGTPKWMVYMENPIKIDVLGVPPFLLETPNCWMQLLFTYGRYPGPDMP